MCLDNQMKAQLVANGMVIHSHIDSFRSRLMLTNLHIPTRAPNITSLLKIFVRRLNEQISRERYLCIEL